VLYLDANVFIYPVLHRGPKSDAAAALLRQVQAGDEAAATCTLTLDEIVWVVAKHAGREAALEAARLVLDLPHLRMLPVREVDARLALELLRKRRKLSPRDALHAACAIGHGIFTVVSDDADFDTLNEIERRPLA
jgi:predicted nucleic acid-binding protein